MKSKNLIRKLLFCSFLFFFSVRLFAQPSEKLVKVLITPDHVNWIYKKGEPAKFKISVTKNRELLSNVKLRYEIGPEMMPASIKDSVILKDGNMVIDGGTMREAGFLRCKVVAEVDGNKYENLATAAFDPDLIQPTTDVPADFIQFWEKAKKEADSIPMDVRLTLLPDRCTESVNVYQASVQNYKIGSRVYGILCVPKKAGKYPAVLKVPGAGVNPYPGDVATAEKGVITFQIGIHGIPVTMDKSIYNDLYESPLDSYWTFNLDDRDHYYFKRVYIGCIRAIDFLFSLPEFDGTNLAVSGGSQGGALSIVTAGLDNRVKYLVAFYPAFCDHTGFLFNRAGGWPQLFIEDNKAYNVKKDKIATSKYYDVVNFARLVKVPGFYSWGFNDIACPPTSMYSAYNVITAPKELLVVPETGHWNYPEQTKKSQEWLIEKLLGK